MAIKGIFVAVALYFGLSWATYSGTVSPKKGVGPWDTQELSRGYARNRGRFDDVDQI